jgi:hypothetical protein
MTTTLGKVQEFTVSAALSEVEFQERLLQAVVREMARLRGGSEVSGRSRCENPSATEAPDVEAMGATHNFSRSAVQCE